MSCSRKTLRQISPWFHQKGELHECAHVELPRFFFLPDRERELSCCILAYIAVVSTGREGVRWQASDQHSQAVRVAFRSDLVEGKARILARQGLPSVTFDLRGVGNSSGR